MKGTTKLLLVCTMAMCISLNGLLAFGQGNSETPTHHNWDISTDLLWLINKNNLPPSVFVRWNKKNDKRLYAYRLRLGGNYYHNTFTDPLYTIADNTSWKYQTTNFRVYFSMGKEWQKWLNDKFQFFYGDDIISDYQRTRLRHAALDSNNPTKKTYPIINEYTLGTSVFAGIKFFLTDRISFSAETHIAVKYFFSKIDDVYADEELNKIIFLTSKKQYVLIEYNQPIQVINITYHL